MAEAVSCPQCGSTKLYKSGIRKTTQGPIQRFLCQNCFYRFSDLGAKFLIKSDVSSQVFEGSDPRKNHTNRSIDRSDTHRPLAQEVKAEMQRILDKLNVPLTIVWTPNPSHSKHGQLELSSRTLFIFDESEDDAWQTLTHELLEFKLKDLLKHYQNIINGLIEVLEKSCYVKKEEFLESIPKIVNMIQEEKKIARSPAASKEKSDD